MSVRHDGPVSWVSNVLVSCDILDREAVNAFSEWLMHDAPRKEGCPAPVSAVSLISLGMVARTGVGPSTRSAICGAVRSTTPILTRLWRGSLPFPGRCPGRRSCSLKIRNSRISVSG
jgi:hypothetical protein